MKFSLPRWQPSSVGVAILFVFVISMNIWLLLREPVHAPIYVSNLSSKLYTSGESVLERVPFPPTYNETLVSYWHRFPPAISFFHGTDVWTSPLVPTFPDADVSSESVEAWKWWSDDSLLHNINDQSPLYKCDATNAYACLLTPYLLLYHTEERLKSLYLDSNYMPTYQLEKATRCHTLMTRLLTTEPYSFQGANWFSLKHDQWDQGACQIYGVSVSTLLQMRSGRQPSHAVWTFMKLQKSKEDAIRNAYELCLAQFQQTQGKAFNMRDPEYICPHELAQALSQRKKVTIVIARYKDDLSWLNRLKADLFEVVIYSRPGSAREPVHIYNGISVRYIHLDYNFADEATVYLEFIITHYSSRDLSPYIVFIHGHDTSYHNVGSMTDRLNHFRYGFLPFMDLNYESYKCFLLPGEEHDWAYEGDRKVWRSVMLPLGSLLPSEQVMCVHPYAQFVVSRERILAQHRSKYILLMEHLKRMAGSDHDAYLQTPLKMKRRRVKFVFIESFWHVLFGEALQASKLLPCMYEDCSQSTAANHHRMRGAG